MNTELQQFLMTEPDGTLETIADIVAKEGVLRQAMIVVSHVLDSEYELSKLYDKGFAHMYRSAKD